MTDRELVLDLGVEGGGATVYRTRHAAGGWQFYVEGCSMYLDENDDEGWRSWTGDRFQTIQEALRSIAEDGSWVLFHPTSVHPEYRTIVWEYAQEIARTLPERHSSIWERRKQVWQRLCLEMS